MASVEGLPIEIIDEVSAADLSAEKMVQTAETISLLQDPTVQSICEMERLESPHGVLLCFTEHAAVIAKMQFATSDETGIVDDESIRNGFREMGAAAMLRGINDFLTVPYALATSQDEVDPSEYLRLFRRQDLQIASNKLAEMYVHYTEQGLVGSDGNTDNMYHAAQALRMRNIITVFQAGEQIDRNQIEYELNWLYNEGMTDAEKEVDVSLFESLMEEFDQPELDKRRINTALHRFPEDDRQVAINRAANYLLTSHSLGRLLHITDPGEIRRQYMQVFRAMSKTDIPALRARISAVTAHVTDSNDVSPADTAAIIESTRLTWEVLPKEEDLQRRAAAIVEIAKERGVKDAQIDLGRLAVLSNVSHLWSRDDGHESFYAYGSLDTRQTVQTDDQEAPDQYLLAVLQKKDAAGEVVAENVVGESPIAGPHAMYVYRQDVSLGRDWREVFNQPKSIARGLGARAVKHVVVEGETMNESMTRKAMALLLCRKEIFPLIQFVGKNNRIAR